MGLLLTISIDSFFWQQFPLWPEFSAFLYNTIKGHSSEWGVSPWHFYFTSSLPRLLFNPLLYILLIPTSLLLPTTRTRSTDILVPVLSFVAIYSILPHKEWRFIIYTIPLLNAAAAAGAGYIYTHRTRSILYRLLTVVLLASIPIMFAASTAMAIISGLNYPGGIAITRLHALANLEQPLVHVHLDNLSCQSGVTRFLQHRTGVLNITPDEALAQTAGQTLWYYDKTDDEERLLDPEFWLRFDYALAEHQEKVVGKWEILDTVYGYSGIRVVRPGTVLERECQDVGSEGLCRTWKMVEGALREKIMRGWWVDVKMEPKIRVLQRQKGSLPV